MSRRKFGRLLFGDFMATTRKQRLTDKELQAILKQSPKHKCIALAARTVVRVIPRLLPPKDTTFLLYVLRAAITALVEAKYSDDSAIAILGVEAAELLEEYSVGHHNLDKGALQDAVRDAAMEAAQGSAFGCLGSVKILGAEYRERFEADLNASEDPLQLPLFEKVRDIDRFLPAVKSNSYDLDFWTRWHAAFLNGNPLPWALQLSVAQIPDEIWAMGVERVAEEIRKLEFEYNTSSNQRLTQNKLSGLFRTESNLSPPKEVRDFVVRRISLALDSAIQSTGDNEFNDTCYEAIVIHGVLSLEGASTSDLATNFFDAALSLKQNINSIYPDDTSLQNLANALAAVTEELCELDDKAKERCALLAGYNPGKSVENLPPTELAKVPEVVSVHLDPSAKSILEDDIGQILDPVRPNTRVVRMRLTNWLSTLSIWMDRTMKGDKRAKWVADVVRRLRGWWAEGQD